ncbi:HEXXH motif domain-containing protein [Actinocorallia longicatena]|uniref:HEXXH motif domain-containing protein n=1 Tax=Actinocorallia longicatena TaxID=111803 RepID=A0ABP6QPP4_9ACTN
MRPHHHLSGEALALLASGGSDGPTLRELASAQRSKQALLLWGVDRLARTVEHPEAPAAARALDLLRTLQRLHPAAARYVMANPAVSAWSMTELRLLRAQDAGARPGQLAALAAAAAIRARWTCVVEVPTFDGRVVLPTLGSTATAVPDQVARVTVGGEAAHVEVGDQRIRITAAPAEGSGWLPMRTTHVGAPGEDITFLIDDLHPSRMPGEILADRLSEKDIARWTTRLDDGWALLNAHHPSRTTEVRALTGTLTPLVPPESVGIRSASSRETFGCVAMSIPPDGRATALTFVHEIQHTKLCAILDIVRLTGPDRGRRFYAPWRDDPRPSDGLLQGSYAFLGVSGFWRRQRLIDRGTAADTAHTEFARWRDAAELVCTTLLEGGDLNEQGRSFVTVMLRILESWARDEVPAGAVAAARRSAEEHLREWKIRHGG